MSAGNVVGAARCLATVRSLVCALLACASLFAPRIATATSLGDSLSGTAKRDYDAGRLLYASGDFQSASLKFQHAYELSHEPQLLWNVVVCYKNLRKYVQVKSWAQQYLESGGQKLTARDRMEAQQLLSAISAFITPVDVESTPPGAQVSVDGAVVGVTPLALELELGEHAFSISHPGYVSKSVTERAVSSDRQKIAVALQAAPSVLALVIEPPTALVYVDGRRLPSGSTEVSLESGEHRLRVSAAGRATYTRTVVLAPDKRRTLFVKLDESHSALPWIALGGGAVLAASTVAYFLVRSSHAPPTSRPINGSLGNAILP